MSKKFNIKPPLWPREYTFVEFVKLNRQINENQIVSLYNQYLNKYLDELGQKKIHFKQSKITQLLTELKESQLHEVIDTNAPGGSYQDAFSNNYSLTFTGDTSGDSEFVSTTFDPVDYNLGTGGFTVSFWVRPDEFGAHMFALGRREAGTTGRFVFGLYKDILDKSVMYVGVGDSKKQTIANGMDYDSEGVNDHNSPGRWYNWVITYAGHDSSATQTERTLRYYINGTLMHDTWTNWTNTDNGCPIYFGGRNVGGGNPYDNGWACGLDEVAIFDEIKDVEPLYNSGIPSDQTGNSGLVGYWRFEEGAGTTVKDLSGNDNHGTLTTNDSGLPTWSTDTPWYY